MAANEIQVGRFNALLHKLLDMKEGAPAPVLAPEVFATIPFATPRPEWDFLQGIYHKTIERQAAAVVANFSMVELWNPPTTGTLVVLEGIHNFAASAGHYIRSIVTQVIGAPTMGANIDSRGPRWGDGVGQASVLQVGSGAGGAVLGTPLNFIYLNRGAFEPFTYIVTPGTGVLVAGGAVNTALALDFWWYERPLEPSESR